VKVGNAAERQKLLEDLRMQLKELMLLSASLDGPMRDSPSDDEVTPVQKLTLAIERVLEHGLQGRFAFFLRVYLKLCVDRESWRETNFLALVGKSGTVTSVAGACSCDS